MCVVWIIFGDTALLAFAAPSDGAALFKDRRASCHRDTAIGKAPPASALRCLTPENILRSLESCPVQSQGGSLTAEETQALTRSLTRGPASADHGFVLAANPRAASGLPGSGLLGRVLHIPESSGVRLGGMLFLDGNWLAAGGVKPNSVLGNFGLGLSLDVDTMKALHIEGGEFRAEYLEFDGGNVNGYAGSVQNYNVLVGSAPFNRHELYQLWWRQNLFRDKLFIKIGKINGTGEFGQVLIPVPVPEPQMQDWTISDLIYVPVVENPTLFNRLPGYYDTAYGVIATLTPVKSLDFSYGLFDGNSARFVKTGLENVPNFNGYQFHIGEVGHSWRLKNEGKPGKVAAGVWRQTGKLQKADSTFEDGAYGFYVLGSQRLWYRHPGKDPSGVTVFAQYGRTPSTSTIATSAVNGGLTALGLIPGRPGDSFGVGVAWAGLNTIPGAGAALFPNVPSASTSLRSHELMWQGYYTATLIPWRIALEGAYTSIPSPGARPDIPWAHAFTGRVIVFF